MSARALLEEYYRVVWTEGDLDAVDRFFAPRAEAEGILPAEPATPEPATREPATRENVRTVVEVARGLIHRPRFRVLRLVEDGEWASAVGVIEGTAVANGAPVRVEGQVMFRTEGGRFVEAHNCFDMLSVLVQVSALPPDALLRLLGGEPVA